QSGTRSWGSAVNTGRPYTGPSAAPMIGDINGDGKKDIVFVGATNTWQVYFGNASGTLDAAVDSGISAGPLPGSARVVDYDSDGRADVLYKSSTVWHVLRYNGTSFSDLATSFSVSNPLEANIRDFDGDGLRDWIYRDGQTVKWIRNTGSGFF